MSQRIEPIGPDRTVKPVDLARLTPLEREQERQRRERERERRGKAAGRRPKPPEDRPGGIDIRV
jgi:hypothetical protein